MDEEELITGYHTTKRENIKSILNNGFYMSPPNKGHWLGKGVYFFEDIYYAIEWKIIGVLKKQYIENEDELKKASILATKIDVKDYEMIDLSTPYGCDIFITFLEVIKENFSEEEYRDILEKGDKYIINALEKLENIKKEKYLSEFDIVCADYDKRIIKKNKIKEENFISGTQKQICVKNLNAIIRNKQLNEDMEDNEYKRNYDLVIKNRREII